jgi:hypothetical protein
VAGLHAKACERSFFAGSNDARNPNLASSAAVAKAGFLRVVVGESKGSQKAYERWFFASSNDGTRQPES